MPPPAADPFRWLVELREQLAPAVELIGPHGDLVLPVARGETAARLRRLATPPLAPDLQALVRQAASQRAVAVAHAEGLRLAALTAPDGSGALLTLLVAERADTGRDATRRAELARVTTWLARALRRSLLAAPDDPVRDWHQLSVLHRMLNKAVANGSVTAVMEAFVEAVAVWADIDARAYVGDRAGRFTLEVALAGADPTAAPRLIPSEALSNLTGPVRADGSQADRLGFRPGIGVVLAPLRSDHTANWLLVYLGTNSALEQDRLGLFHDLLLPALQSASEVEASRLMWSMMQQLVGDRASPRDAVADALSELEQAGLCTAAMLVLRRAGEIILELGTPAPHGPGGTPWPSPALQQFSLAVPDPFEASLTLWRPVDRPFTGRETRLGAIGASVLASWTAGALRRGDLAGAPRAAGGTDRRRPHLQRAPAVSLLVIRPETADATADLRELWVGEIRRRLRPADVAGALASGEIGVLLPGAESDDAQAVASRLRRAFGQLNALTLLDGAPIGIATGHRQASDGYSMLRDARTHADGSSSSA